MKSIDIKRICVVVGHYGSGKTNLAVNLATCLANSGSKTNIIDLDIVNPYFRTADFKNMFDKKGISMTSSVYAVSNLDIPAITFDLNSIAAGSENVIIDVGGDDAGAVALGQYRSTFEQFANETDVLYVVNMYRPMTDTPDKAVQILKEIEQISRLKATAVVNNSNLGTETTVQTVLNSVDYAKKVAELCDVDFKFTAYPDWIEPTKLPRDEKFVPVKRFVKTLWEDNAPNF